MSGNLKNFEIRDKKAYITLKRLSVKIWTSEAVLIRSQKEMRNMLFTGNWRKGDLCDKVL